MVDHFTLPKSLLKNFFNHTFTSTMGTAPPDPTKVLGTMQVDATPPTEDAPATPPTEDAPATPPAEDATATPPAEDAPSTPPAEDATPPDAPSTPPAEDAPSTPPATPPAEDADPEEEVSKPPADDAGPSDPETADVQAGVTPNGITKPASDDRLDTSNSEIEVHVDSVIDLTPQHAQEYADARTTRVLKDLCKKHGLNATGKKIDMAARILNHSAEEPVIILDD